MSRLSERLFPGLVLLQANEAFEGPGPSIALRADPAIPCHGPLRRARQKKTCLMPEGALHLRPCATIIAVPPVRQIHSFCP